MNKTNAIRFLDTNKIEYEVFEYPSNGKIDAISVSKYLDEDASQVFKTLVTISNSKVHYVFVVPGNKELDLKKAAKVSGNKKVDLIAMKDLLSTTGYIRGGCSPIGMKKAFPTYFHMTCMQYDYIYVSAGQRGLQIKIAPGDLVNYVGAATDDITINKD